MPVLSFVTCTLAALTRGRRASRRLVMRLDISASGCLCSYLAILHGAHRSQNACDGQSASPSRHLTMSSPVLICGRNSSSINSLNFLCVHIGLRLQPVSESGKPGSAMVGGQRANAVGVPASRTLTKGNSQCRSLQLLARRALAVRGEMNNLNVVLCL